MGDVFAWRLTSSHLGWRTPLWTICAVGGMVRAPVRQGRTPSGPTGGPMARWAPRLGTLGPAEEQSADAPSNRGPHLSPNHADLPVATSARRFPCREPKLNVAR